MTSSSEFETPSIRVLTSLPPQRRQRRWLGDGTEVTETYARQCIQSWQKTCSRVFSINSSEEIDLMLPTDVSLLRVGRDAKDDVGRPLVYVADMLKHLDGMSNNEFAAIINADVFLPDPAQIQRSIMELEPREFLLAHRLDVSKISGSNDVGDVYRQGFDFLVLRGDQVGYFAASRLVFGAPWWDHFIPLSLIWAGYTPKILDAHHVVSLRHGGRWSQEDWIEMGARFASEASDAIKSFRSSGPLRGSLVYSVAVRSAAAVLRHRESSRVARACSTILLRALSQLNLVAIWLAARRRARGPGRRRPRQRPV